MRRLILITPNWLKDFAGAWVFYTVLPKLPRIKPRFKRIARFAPLIGLTVSLIQSCIWLILYKSGWSKESLSFLILAAGILITGGLHCDGLIDTADGIAAGKKKQSHAMKDSRIGAIGALALLSLLAIQIGSLIKLGLYTPIAIAISSFWGRFSSIWAISFFPYLHQTNTINSHKYHWQGYLKESKISLIIFLFFISILFLTPIDYYLKVLLLIGSISGFIASIWIPNCLGNFLGGHSGDSYGACVVLVETFMLFILAMILTAS